MNNIIKINNIIQYYYIVYMSKEKQLFKYIKNHQYDDLIKLIKSDDKIDLNEQDDNGVYLIQYAIMFGQRDIIALLISRNCKLDIIDSEGKGIFYLPIKFGYIEIIRLLINFSNVVVGIPLLEMQDSLSNIPIHYAIMFNRMDITKEMLATNFNLNIKDVNGDTILHLIIKNIKKNKENYELIQTLIDKKIGINHINKLGQTALHIAVDNGNLDICTILLKNNINIDVETIDNHLTPLLIATIQNNYEICDLLLKYKPNLNCQDVYGNSILNHAIKNKSKSLIELYYDKVNINLININGNNTLNIFFEEKYELNKLDDYMFRPILDKTKMNSQNDQGKTSWHYLVKDNIWENYIDILENKKNKIFIQDINGISPYDIIIKEYPKSKDKFIDLITISFYNIITKKGIDKYKLDIKCIKDIVNLKKEITDKDKKKCINSIRTLILEHNISYPEKKKSYCINDINTDLIKFSSYVGITLDIICGLIYLKLPQHKFGSSIQTSLTKDFILNPNLENYYQSNGIEKGLYGDFLNFEIIWSYQKLFIPTIIKKLITDFNSDKSKRYLVIPIGIELSNGAHANILLYDKENNSMERFEPYGSNFPPGFNYNPNILDQYLERLFSNYFTEKINDKDFTYYKPLSYEGKVGFQLLDTIEYAKEKNIGDPGGFCGAWSLWYIEMRISNPNIERGPLINKLINYIRIKAVSFRSVIRNFTKKITDIRDDILAQADIDINQFLNENYKKDNWDKLINIISENS